MDESFLKQIKNEAIAFNRRLDSQLDVLTKEGLISAREQVRLKGVALRYREALEESFRTPLTSPIQESLISCLVKDYEQAVNKQISEIIRCKYSEKRIKIQLEELIKSYWSAISDKLSQESSVSAKEIKKEVESLRLETWKNLKNNLKSSSEEQKPILVEQALESLKKELDSIEAKYFTKQSAQSNDAQINSLSEEQEITVQGSSWIWQKKEGEQVIVFYSPDLHPSKSLLHKC